MPEEREEFMEDLISIPMKPIIPAIPTNDKEIWELKEDLRAMGCTGLLARPWNVQSKDTLREFLYERGNQWDETKRRDPGNWTPGTWANVYWFDKGIKEGWAGRKAGPVAGKLKGEVDPKEGLHPMNFKNPKGRKMIDFMMPILNLEKPKRITLTMANTLFGALFGVRTVNWGIIIYEIVARAIPYIGWKPFYISPSSCTSTHITGAPQSMRITAAKEIAYKLQPVALDASTSSDRPILEGPPSSLGSPPKSFWRPESPPPPSPRHHPQSLNAAGPSRTHPEALWQNVDLSTWRFPDNPFQRVYVDLAYLLTQYYQLEHITMRANQPLNDCGPENILGELAK